MPYPQNTAEMRKGNMRTVLETVIKHGPLSKREVQRLTGFSWGAVSTLSHKLTDMGIISLTDTKETSVGRKPSLLDINGNNFLTVGIDLNIQGLCGIVADMRGNVLLQKCRAVSEKKKEAVTGALFSLIDDLLSEKCHGKTLLGIGVAVQGSVLPDEGISVRLPQVDDWCDVPLKSLISERFGCSNVKLLHDPDCLMIAEEKSGAAEMRSVKSAILIRLDESIGFSMLSDGKIYSGADGRSGELAHYPVVQGGALCTCGKHGCLEQYASGGGIVNRIKEIIPSGKTSVTAESLVKYGYKAVAEAASSGDSAALEVFSNMGTYLGFALGGVINLLSPEAVILYGSLTAYRRLFFCSLEKSISNHIYDGAKTALSFSELPENAPALGIALAVIDSAVCSLSTDEN